MKKSVLGLLLRAVLMLAMIAGASLAFWVPLRRAEDSHIRHLSKFATQSVQTLLANEMRSRLLALVRLAQVCVIEENVKKKAWESYAGLFLSHHPGYLALQLVDREDRVRLSFHQAQDSSVLDPLLTADGALEPALQESRRKRDVILTPAFLLRNGSTGHVAVAPIDNTDHPAEFVIAVFDDQKVLGDILADETDRGYAISVLEGNRQVYRTPDSDTESAGAWQEHAEVFLPGITWNIEVWPKVSFLGSAQSKLPQLAALAGLAIGLLLVVTLEFARQAGAKTRDLRRIREQLEVRVRERTGEVKALRKKFEAEIGVLEQTKKELSGQLLQLRDDERRRIGRELHDGTTQIIAALAIDLEMLRDVVARRDSLKAQELLVESSELAAQAAAELRTVSYLLHPPILDGLGLEGVLPRYVDGFSNRSGIGVSINMQPQLGRLPSDVEVTLFRILQEALTNIHRHSGSATAEVTLFRTENQITLEISDQGRGIPQKLLESLVNQQVFIGIGIPGMRERMRQLGGCLDIESGGKGTSIKVTAPIKTSESPGA